MNQNVPDKVWTLDLTEECSAQMLITGQVTKEALEIFERFVELMKRCVPDAHSEEQL